ncbi:MAG: lipopolysaccharide kinase InaA family protein [Planctomycetota bacterium]
MTSDPISKQSAFSQSASDTSLVIHKSGARTTWSLPSSQKTVLASGFVDGNSEFPSAGQRSGRTEHPVYRTQNNELLMWKKCLRGGLLSHLIHDRHLRPARFIQEMEMCQRVNQHGIPTSQILAVAATSAGIGYRIEMLVRLEIGVRTLLEILADTTVSPNERRQILDATANTIHQFHEQGWLHGDLNLMNILVQKSDTEKYRIVLVDLDPGGLSPTTDRLGNLTRLVRSYRKSRIDKIAALNHGEGFRFLYQASGGNRQLLVSLIEKTRQLLNREDFNR